VKGLAVIDGDLVLFGGSYLLLSGAARIKQDLTFALRDEYGADPSHPYWGSLLRRYIGQPITESLRQQILTEIQRVLSNYISVQADQVNRTISSGVLGNFDTGDVVRNVTSIDVEPDLDRIRVSVALTTMAGETVKIARTVTV
jgi:phage baseplate assembly protein W